MQCVHGLDDARQALEEVIRVESRASSKGEAVASRQSSVASKQSSPQPIGSCLNSPLTGESESGSDPVGGQLHGSSNHAPPTLSLCSPPFAACHAGIHYYQQMLAQLQAEFPDVPFTFTLCCGDDPALAYEALRLGFRSIRCDADAVFMAQLQAVAVATGARIEAWSESAPRCHSERSARISFNQPPDSSLCSE